MKIFVTTRFAAFHHWPEAPEEVKFLRDLHRHVFHVKVTLHVDHVDRDIEFIRFKAQLEDVIIDKLQRHLILNPHFSCEMMCEFIWREIILLRQVPAMIEVSEDGENGAILDDQ